MYSKPTVTIITSNDLMKIKLEANSGIDPFRASGAWIGVMGEGCVAYPQQGY